MGKISKVSRIDSRPSAIKSTRERPGGYTCPVCGKTYSRQKDHFQVSQSSLYKGNNGRLTVCNECLDALYEHYLEALGSHEAALRRMCMKFDIYWSAKSFEAFKKVNSQSSRIRSYIHKIGTLSFHGKTYDDTLDEEANAALDATLAAMPMDAADAAPAVTPVDCISDGSEAEPEEPIPEETIVFWGSGFDRAFYDDLNQRYERWTGELPKPLTPAQEALYKQICLQEININRNLREGKNIEQGQNALNNLLGSLNERPRQQAQQVESSESDNTPLGVWIRRWEEDRPVPEYVPSESDKPGLIKYITTWFFGHTAKALGLKNMYSQVYEDEIARYRVAKPEFEGEDDDMIIGDMVGGANDP